MHIKHNKYLSIEQVSNFLNEDDTIGYISLT